MRFWWGQRLLNERHRPKQWPVKGVAGIAFNYALLGLDYYRATGPVVDKLIRAGLFLQVQVTGEQMHTLEP